MPPLDDVVETFPFGAQVRPCGAELPAEQKAVFLLGAYPSALHVRWNPPSGYGPTVAAIPVDNEPTPFWDGSQPDSETLFEEWRDTYFDSAWGSVAPSPLNGSSGRHLEARWLRPLGFSMEDAFITDCLLTARASVGVAKRLADRYERVSGQLHAPVAHLASHPTENDIVAESLRHHVDRLTMQLEKASPVVVVSLGNAAARVVGALASRSDRESVLRPDGYGQERRVLVAGLEVVWRALVHPATPRVWAERHALWSTAAGAPQVAE